MSAKHWSQGVQKIALFTHEEGSEESVNFHIFFFLNEGFPKFKWIFTAKEMSYNERQRVPVCQPSSGNEAQIKRKIYKIYKKVREVFKMELRKHKRNSQDWRIIFVNRNLLFKINIEHCTKRHLLKKNCLIKVTENFVGNMRLREEKSLSGDYY